MCMSSCSACSTRRVRPCDAVVNACRCRHDTLYPSLDVVNADAGTPDQLKQLAAFGAQNNAVVSYHINVNDAYEGFDGRSNPDFNASFMATEPDGSLRIGWPFGHTLPHTNQTVDKTQGIGRRISMAKDRQQKRRYTRFDRMWKAAPRPKAHNAGQLGTIHCDSWGSRDVRATSLGDRVETKQGVGAGAWCGFTRVRASVLPFTVCATHD